MSATQKLVQTCFAIFLFFYMSSISLAQSFKSDIGYDQLQAQVGGSLENGAGIRTSMVEANFTTPPNGVFLPDTSNSEFTGKTIVNGSPALNDIGPSGHATGVAQFLFGNTLSIAGGVTQVTAFDAVNWIVTNLGFPSGSFPNHDPLIQNFRVQNHSYVGNDPAAADINMRMDFMINRDNVTVVVAQNNRNPEVPTIPLPQYFSQSYNAITVGLSNGNHSFGLTTIDGVGRTKPDIVAPSGTTSVATPIVGSVAILLHQKAINMGPSGVDATHSETMKAIMMAGATKNESEFVNPWSHTQTQPLDAVYGAGEVNVFNSYNILEGGQFNGSLTQPSSLIGLNGWDYGASITAGSPLSYNFEIPTGQSLAEGTVLLTWNSNVTDQDPSSVFDPSRTLADLNLRFFNSTNTYLGTQIDASLSQVDNVEMLWLKNLDAGLYTIQVDSNSASSFGLAWTLSAVPEPSQWLLMLCGAGVLGWIFAARMPRVTAENSSGASQATVN